MTLREKLDEKIKTPPTPMWEELEAIFLSVKPELLKEGIQVSVFKNGAFARICYKLSSTEGKMGKSFSGYYTIKDLETVVQIARENGIEVNVLQEEWNYEFIYTPSWK